MRNLMQWLGGGAIALALFDCGEPVHTVDTPSLSNDSTQSNEELHSGPAALKHVFVIPLENVDAAEIYGNRNDAPYINDVLIANYGHATAFVDELPNLPSQPHYMWMEAGTNAFADHTFETDDPPSATNSTAHTEHLVSQIRASNGRVSWRSYQEGLNAQTGACPIFPAVFYAPKHNPFVYFQDIAGSPPAPDTPYCAEHHRGYDRLADDLAIGDVASFTHITPDLCHDMHGHKGCPDANRVRAADRWLSQEVPQLERFANEHAGVIFIVWDESTKDGSSPWIPFLVIGSGVKKGYASSLVYDHRSLLKSIEEILELPIVEVAKPALDLRDFFEFDGFP